MSEEYSSEFIWSARQITEEIEKHRNDFDWNPHELPEGGFVVKTFEGKPVPAPKQQKENE